MAYGLFYGMTGLSGNLIVLSVFYFGGISMSQESLTIGDLSSFLLYAFWVSRIHCKIDQVTANLFKILFLDRLVFLSPACFHFI